MRQKCKPCLGTGRSRCGACKGSGYLMKRRGSGIPEPCDSPLIATIIGSRYGEVEEIWKCDRCNGTGKIKCRSCQGKGYVNVA